MRPNAASERTLPGCPASRNPDPGALVRELLRPEAYPGPRPSGVEVRHTHGSWVFLTDGEAWKVRRPMEDALVDLPDADCRRRCCEDELWLGQRLAPDVYREVVPLHRGAGGHAFVGRGPVVDYAVRMRRLPEEDSAAMLAAQGRLTAEHLQALAEAMARFYAASPARLGSAGGCLGRASVVENYQQALPFAGRLLDGALLQSVYHWQREMVAAQELPLLDRVARGCVREGHGDLRLEHVYFAGGRAEAPVVIDPLLPAASRWGDTALDIAFLVMELEAQRRPDLTAAFLARFASASDDYDFYQLVDLYVSHRAFTRARVACLVAADPRTAPAKASRKAAEANRLLALAASYR
jgi:aminoglycoside phosphotransferase family enzyme